MKLEVCIDCLESAQNALDGGADELELCSSLSEGGLTPSPGLVTEVIRLRNLHALRNERGQKVKLNVMIRCRSGSNFVFTEQEMTTMLSDIDYYKPMDVDAFVFGALTEENKIDTENCQRVKERARPLPVTFHRAFDICSNPEESLEEIIDIGFKRLLTSGQKESVNEEGAKDLIHSLLLKHSKKIEIIPGSGVSEKNVEDLLKLGCKIVHSSCKSIKKLHCSNINMGSDEVYLTDAGVVRRLKEIGANTEFDVVRRLKEIGANTELLKEIGANTELLEF